MEQEGERKTFMSFIFRCRLTRSLSLGRLTVDQFLDKLPLQVLQEELFGTDLQSLFPGGLEILFLTDVGHESVDLVSLLDEPDEDARGVYRVDLGRESDDSDKLNPIDRLGGVQSYYTYPDHPSRRGGHDPSCLR